MAGLPRIIVLDGPERSGYYDPIRDLLEAEWKNAGTPGSLDELDDYDLALVSFEFFPDYALRVAQMVDAGVPTLHVMEGMVEWRDVWENPRSRDPDLGVPLLQPVLSHKIACYGAAQARLLESWGALGQCEVVGCPRMDPLIGRTPRERAPGDPWRLLVTTATNPGHTQDQRAAALAGLRDVSQWQSENPAMAGAPVEVLWRVTEGLAQAANVAEPRSGWKGSMADVLGRVDAVVTGPSTVQYEAMLHGLPVALLDYTNSPHYVPAAWRITAPRHIGPAFSGLFERSEARMLYQTFILRDHLESRTPAAPRLATLAERMIQHGRAARRRGETLRLPSRILDDPPWRSHAPDQEYDLVRLFPEHPVFSDPEAVREQILLAQTHLRVAQLERQLEEHRGTLVWSLWTWLMSKPLFRRAADWLHNLRTDRR